MNSLNDDGCSGSRVKHKVKKSLPVINGSVADQPAASGRSSIGRWRAGALIALNLLMIAHIVQWKITGETVTPIEPSEAVYTLETGAINAGFIFFTLAILATLIFGRFVCGWACHVLALQDFCGWLMTKAGIKPRAFRSRLLIWVPLLAALYMFVWPTIARWITQPAAPLFPNFTTHLTTTEFWATFPGFWVAVPFLFICGFATVYFLGSKGFCTYACPYGGFFAVADKVSPGRIRVTDACNGCGNCTAVCTSNVTVHAEVRDYGMVTDPGCMKCMDCISACPTDALYFGFGKPAFGVKKKSGSSYSLTWPQELFVAAAFAFTLAAVWNVYQIIPMLMALGIASVTAFLAVKTLRIFDEADSSFHKWLLRRGGKLRPAGIVFISLAAAWMLFIVHSGWIHWHEFKGNRAFASVSLPDELALAQSDPRSWLSAADRQIVNNGREAFATAARTALFTNDFAAPKAAWLEFLAGDPEEAVTRLGNSAVRHEGSQRAINLYYRGAILNRMGRPEAALADLDSALGERGDLSAARLEKGESLWRLGRRDEASAIWGAAGNSPLADLFLAGAKELEGLREEAESFESRAYASAPQDGYFYWMMGLRLANLGMHRLAEVQFEKAIALNPQLQVRRAMNPSRRTG